ncbi:hypothetical protein E2C01_068260 [Portunus trituberculatus]|uniref:Uncharacterized protein n=1 Tax=Portunus trituberculatus TaxID=210409 RepID=A0A5B7HXF2_PORTR|nr:hypothetical protein [Portunus trituberculatus]
MIRSSRLASGGGVLSPIPGTASLADGALPWCPDNPQGNHNSVWQHLILLTIWEANQLIRAVGGVHGDTNLPPAWYKLTWFTISPQTNTALYKT